MLIIIPDLISLCVCVFHKYNHRDWLCQIVHLQRNFFPQFFLFLKQWNRFINYEFFLNFMIIDDDDDDYYLSLSIIIIFLFWKWWWIHIIDLPNVNFMYRFFFLFAKIQRWWQGVWPFFFSLSSENLSNFGFFILLLSQQQQCKIIYRKCFFSVTNYPEIQWNGKKRKKNSD